MLTNYDFFLGYVSEDRADVARPLASHLEHQGIRVFLSEINLDVKQSLQKLVDEGFARSKIGGIILSPDFFAKNWTHKELNELHRQEEKKLKTLLPIWHNIKLSEIIAQSPELAGKIAVSTSQGLDYICSQIVEVRHSLDGHTENYAPHGVGFSNQTSEQQILKNLHIETLDADNIEELQKILKEIEGFLPHYSLSPEVRDLKKKLEMALQRLEKTEHEYDEENYIYLFGVTRISRQVYVIFLWFMLLSSMLFGISLLREMLS